MAQTPPAPPGGRKSPSAGPPIGEDYGDFEGDPTSINQMPQSGPIVRPSVPSQPQMFPQSSPQLSHMGQHPAAPMMQPTQMTQMGVGQMVAQPGPPQTQVDRKST